MNSYLVPFKNKSWEMKSCMQIFIECEVYPELADMSDRE